MVANLGTVSEEYSEFDIPIDYQVAIGISPPLKWASIELTLEYKSLTYEESDLNKLRLGGAFNFGAMHLTAGADSNGLSGGIYYALDQINAGVVFSTTKGLNNDEEFFTQTVYMQLGWRI